jgi:uncharacterized delta-60 repeat protein
MGSLVKSLGEWKNSLPYVKADEEWKIPKSAWTKTSDGWKSWFLQGGLNDSGFNEYDTRGGLNRSPSAIAVQPDGKILVGGNFTTFNAIPIQTFTRFNLDGSLDDNFISALGTGFVNESVTSIAIQTNGQILLLINRPTTFNGVAVKGVVRLNSNLTLDTTFNNNIGTAFGTSEYASGITIQQDGKIILFGGFFESFNGVATKSIVRLNSNGTVDGSFMSNLGSGPGVTSPDNTPSILDVKLQSDGKIIIGGIFDTFNGAVVNHIVRLNSNGTRDALFTTATGSGVTNSLFPTNERISLLLIQPDNKIFIVGIFDTFNGVEAPAGLRLNSNGTVDPTFFLYPEQDRIFRSARVLKIQTDGKIVIGSGPYEGIGANNTPYIVRFNSNGIIDESFSNFISLSLSYDVSAMDIQSDGKIVISSGPGSRIGRINSNGSIDSTFLPNSTTGPSNNVKIVATQKDGKILISGDFDYFNGSASRGFYRLNPDGTIDSAFEENSKNYAVNQLVAIIVQPDQKILICNSFSIRRIHEDGTIDSSFSDNFSETPGWRYGKVILQPDGKIIITNGLNGTTSTRIVRLNSNGSIDTGFSTSISSETNSSFRSIAVQPDGKILVGGNFTTTIGGIVRLNLDGTKDNTFTTDHGNEGIAFISAIGLQSNNKIIIGGIFRSSPTASAILKIKRLNSDGSNDLTFNTGSLGDTNNSIHSLIIQLGEKITLVGNFATFNETVVNRIVRLNSNGTIDTDFITNAGTAFTDALGDSVGGANFSLAVQEDNKLVIGGRFGTFNGTNRTNLVRIGGDVATA